jgi:hypothetical protein
MFTDKIKPKKAMAPLILTGTLKRLEKLENFGPVVEVRIKVAGDGGELKTVMKNPMYDGSDMLGEGWQRDVGQFTKGFKKGFSGALKTTAPILDKAADAGVILGTLSGQPEIIAAAGAAKGVAELVGSGKKKRPLKSLRYKLTTST